MYTLQIHHLIIRSSWYYKILWKLMLPVKQAPQGKITFQRIIIICLSEKQLRPLIVKYSTCCSHSAFMCITWISQLKVIISLHDINWYVWELSRGISMFHRAFFNSLIDKHQHMHFFTFNSILVWNVNFNVKIHKILKGTPTCFDLNRSSSRSRSVPR